MRILLIGALLSVSLHAADYRVIVAGLGGEADYDTRFQLHAAESQKLLGGECEALIGARATKANLKAALEKLTKTTAEDTLTVLLIGHGTFDGLAYKFNLVGPDISAEELRGLLDPIAARQLVVLATSSSGAAVEALRRENRVIITATKSGTEKNAVVFARYWVEAMRDAAADTDKNEILTAAEAFQFAKQKTANFYETQKRIATEHPLLETGGIAQRYAVLRMGTAQKASNDPAKRALLLKKDELETAIDKLKLEKAAMPIDAYKKRLSALLVELAQTQEEIEK
ncbi:MAG TPA: C13 family peptidase [Paludibaculum sp.]